MTKPPRPDDGATLLGVCKVPTGGYGKGRLPESAGNPGRGRTDMMVDDYALIEALATEAEPLAEEALAEEEMLYADQFDDQQREVYKHGFVAGYVKARTSQSSKHRR